MIRVASTQAALLAAIDKASPRWRRKALARTKELVKLGRFEDGKVDWADIKGVYMQLQHNKCCYCERAFEDPDIGKIELDVEHFRPKNAVPTWSGAKSKPAVAFPTGLAMGGYFWLAFDPENYAVSCKICNTIFKSNYFPIAGNRGTISQTPATLRAKSPYLCYPISDLDDDPEQLITFDATLAIPAAKDAARRRRAEVIIDFFGLNARTALHTERAQMIVLFAPHLAKAARGKANAGEATLVSAMDSPKVRHANCVRSFKRTWLRDAARGRRIYEECREFVSKELNITLTPA